MWAGELGLTMYGCFADSALNVRYSRKSDASSEPRESLLATSAGDLEAMLWRVLSMFPFTCCQCTRTLHDGWEREKVRYTLQVVKLLPTRYSQSSYDREPRLGVD